MQYILKCTLTSDNMESKLAARLGTVIFRCQKTAASRHGSYTAAFFTQGI